MKRSFRIILITFVLVMLCAASAFASANELPFTSSSASGEYVLTASQPVKAVYLVFDTEPSAYTVNGVEVENHEFIQQYIEIASSNTVTISGAKPKSVYLFDDTDVPEWVHTWQSPYQKADILLISSHADDEQLFFAGLLPYYTQVRGLAVQVAYATDHLSQLSRHHERLDGLWEVGVRNYPVSSGFNDLYSESASEALANLSQYGVSEDMIIDWVKSLITDFEPQVIVTHDVNGEYSHGMHQLVNSIVSKAIADAETEFPFLKKTYYHLYDKNQIRLDVIDQSFDELGGLTPFQVTQKKGFPCHESQQWTWFKRWINGSNNEISKASQITTYSPLEYGCYYSSVGLDVNKDDIFENLTSYEEQLREAEELKKAEEEAALLEAQKKAEAERLEQIASQQRRKTAAVIIAAALAAAIIVLLLKRNRV